jgi:hypothetical protein
MDNVIFTTWDGRILTPLKNYASDKRVAPPKTDEEIKEAIAKAYRAGLLDAEYKRERRVCGKYYTQTYKVKEDGKD